MFRAQFNLDNFNQFHANFATFLFIQKISIPSICIYPTLGDFWT